MALNEVGLASRALIRIRVSGGQITLGHPVHVIEVGLAYTHMIEPLPPNAVGASGGGRKVRLIKALMRLQETAVLRMDTGQGLRDIPLQRLSESSVFDAPLPLVSADIDVRALGGT